MSFSILGLGTALPEHTFDQMEGAEIAQQVCCETEEQGRLLKVLYRRSGVQNRHICVPHHTALKWLHNGNGNGQPNYGPTTRERMELYHEHSLPLARQAAERALAEADVERKSITHLVTASCTGFSAPGVDIDLITGLDLASTTQRVNVGFMGCHGAINAMRTALAFATADPAARVLICAVELCSLHYRYRWDPERIVGNALFADGSAAIVAGNVEAGDELWRVAATGSCLVPDSTDAMTWRLGDNGFEMTLSARVPDLIERHLRPWLTRWLASEGTSIEAIGSWAVHPGGPRILSAVEESLALPREATAVSREVLAQCGNMSSPTVLFILDRLRRSGAPRPCVALAFGPGLVAEAALLV